jgi:glutathione synthase
MIRHIFASTSYLFASPCLTGNNFPENSSTSGLAEGLAEVHDAYGVRGSVMFLYLDGAPVNRY